MNKVQPHAKYRPGDVVTLKAVRASEMGVFLDAGTGNTDDDILLHKLQQETEVKVGDSVKVYPLRATAVLSISAQSAAYFCRTARCAGMCRRGSLYGLSCTVIKQAVRL